MRKLFTFLLLGLLTLGLYAAPMPDFDALVQQRLQEQRADQIAQWDRYLQRNPEDMQNYDVRYYAIDLAVNFQTHSITGDNQIRVEIVDNNVSQLIFDFTTNLIVDGVSQQGSALNYEHANYQLTVELGQTYSIGDTLTLAIQYHGQPVEPTRYGWGFVFDEHAGEPIAYTMVEPSAARDWWPCKDVPEDKADSLDVWITCPDNYLCASNGSLEETIDNGNGTKTFKWHEKHPIVTYLVSVSMTNYTLQTTTYEYNGQQMPIENYVFPEQYDQSVSLFGETSDMIDFLNTVYGTYPFLDEKYGHAVYPGSGAMEHQTCTSFGDSGVMGYHSYTVLHELAHQWAGDLITCETWDHIWLNEGFATYSEVLWAEHLHGQAGYDNYIRSLDLGPRIDSKLSRLINGNFYNILDIVVYYKGAWTLHMLRGVLGDETFFDVIQAYMHADSLRYNTAVTDDLCAIAEQVSGQELSWFFDQWFLQNGRPQYEYNVYVSDELDSLKIYLNAQGSQGAFFQMPVPIQMNDETITIEPVEGQQEITLPLTEPLESFVWDVGDWVLDYAETSLPEFEMEDNQLDSVSIHILPYADDSIDGFNIYRKTNDEAFALMTPTPITDAYWTDINFESGNTYHYKITAVKGDYESLPSLTQTFYAPAFSLDQGILLVDESANVETGSPYPTDAEADAFYANILSDVAYTQWDVDEQGIVPLHEMAKYSTIIWYSAELGSYHLAEAESSLMLYLNAGGHLIIDGWKVLSGVSDNFLQNYLHVDAAENATSIEFAGALGVGDYADVALDPSRIMPSLNGHLRSIYKFVPQNDAEVILQFDAYNNEAEWENQPCAAAYWGNDFQTVTIGFPLYYAQYADARTLLRQLLRNLGETVPTANATVSIPLLGTLSNYPNPFNPETTITFSVPKDGPVHMAIYNVKGQKVKTLIAETKPSGTHSIIWNGHNDNGESVSSGLYFARLQWNGKTQTVKKMILMK